jgi:hypothetical protein
VTKHSTGCGQSTGDVENYYLALTVSILAPRSWHGSRADRSVSQAQGMVLVVYMSLAAVAGVSSRDLLFVVVFVPFVVEDRFHEWLLR